MQPITELPSLADASDPVGPPKDHAEPSWLAWLMGAALLASVVVVAAHVSDLREFARMMEQTKPAWLLIALALQLATYASQGAIWRVVGRAASSSIPARFALPLSVAERFVDQALLTGGVSGTAFVAHVLRDRGYPRDVHQLHARLGLSIDRHCAGADSGPSKRHRCSRCMPPVHRWRSRSPRRCSFVV